MESLTMRVWATALSFLLLLVPVGASALGLENIEVNSALNEPLEARIALRSLQEGDLEGMEVNLGTAEQFRRAGVDRPFLLSRLNFEVVDRGGGQGHIRVTTKNPVVEPFLNFLLEVTWPRGRIVREYTLLLDPPVYGAAIASAAKESASVRRAEEPAPAPPARIPEAPAAPSAAEAPPMPAPPAEPPTTVASPAAPAPEPAVPGFEPEPEPAAPAVAAPEPMAEPEPAPSVARVPSPLPADLAPGEYEVQRGDTLWSLATRYRPDGSVSINRMMLAMLNANPEAFTIPNINALRAGAVLRIPDRGELAGDPREEILAEVNRQHGLWSEYRSNLGMTVAEAPQGTMVEGTPGESAPGAGEPASAAAEPESEPSAETAGGGEAAGGAPAEPDRLELVSAGDATAGAGTASSDAEDAARLRQELTLAEEEADARRREAEELDDKLREAEEIIEQQTRLLELRDDNIAALQDMLAKAEAEAEKLREAAEEAAAAAGTGVEPSPEGPEEPAAETPETGAPPAEPEAAAVASPEPEPAPPEPEPATPETEPATQAPEPAQPAEPEAVEPAQPEEPESTAIATAEPEPTQQPAQQQRRDIPAPPSPPPPSFLETVLDSLPVDPVLLGAGVGGLLVVLGGAALWRRRRGGEEGESLDELEEALTDEERAILAQYGDGAEPAMEEPEAEIGPPPAPEPEPSEEQADDELSSTLISAPGAADQARAEEGEEDPLTEVNVYLAYERYDQAEELVRSAIQQYPDRHEYKLRLLEVFYAAKDTASFETAARELSDAVGGGGPLLDEAQKMWQDMSPGRGLFDSAESTVPEDQDVAFDITGPEGQGDATIPIGTPEGVDESSSVDFDLGFEGAAAAGGGETGSQDSSVDFDLGFEAEEKTQPASEAGLDFDLGGGEGQEAGATGGGSSSLDFDLTEIDSGDQGGDADAPLVERAAGGDDLDFDMGDLEERTLVDSQGPPRFGELEDQPAGGEQGGDLDFDLDSLEGDSSPAADTGAASVDADVTALDFDLGAAADAGGAAEETTASQSSGLDLDFDVGEEAERTPETTPAEGFDIGGEGLEVPSTGGASMDEELDFGLNLDDAGGDQEAVSGKSSLDLALSLDEDEGGGGAQDEDAMGLDFSLEDSAKESGEGGEDAFDTVKIQRGEGDEGDSELPELDMDFDLDAQSGSAEAEGEAIDTDFEGIFDAGAPEEQQAGGAKGGDDEDEMALSMDLADLSPEPTPDKDMSTDLPDIDLDFESGQEEPEQDEFEATQYMLRDVPSSASEEPESDDEGRTLMLGGGLTGEVDEIQTKLDLAQAYIDMGDNDGAKGILDEVISEGNDAQKQAAMGLIDKLTGS